MSFIVSTVSPNLIRPCEEALIPLLYPELVASLVFHPTPAFPIYESMINYTGSTPVPYDLTEDKDLKFDPDKILSLITDKTRLLILINPNNPTGSFVEKPVIDYFAKELEKHPHVTILSDEIYSRQIFDYKEMPSFFHYEALKEDRKSVV